MKKYEKPILDLVITQVDDVILQSINLSDTNLDIDTDIDAIF